MNRSNFLEEKVLKDCFVVGVDEVGRGALAGPVVAGAVCLPKGQEKFWTTLGINDSKKLSPKKRQELSKIILENALFGIGEVSASYINSHGIVSATEKAMRIAVKNLRSNVKDENKCFLLIDAFNLRYVPHVGLKMQKAIIKGDQKSVSIAAASIIAKVYRDELMKSLDEKFPQYGFSVNKGYGTNKHLIAIKTSGISKTHRKLFIRKLI